MKSYFQIQTSTQLSLFQPLFPRRRSQGRFPRNFIGSLSLSIPLPPQSLLNPRLLIQLLIHSDVTTHPTSTDSHVLSQAKILKVLQFHSGVSCVHWFGKVLVSQWLFFSLTICIHAGATNCRFSPIVFITTRGCFCVFGKVLM